MRAAKPEGFGLLRSIENQVFAARKKRRCFIDALYVAFGGEKLKENPI